MIHGGPSRFPTLVPKNGKQFASFQTPMRAVDLRLRPHHDRCESICAGCAYIELIISERLLTSRTCWTRQSGTEHSRRRDRLRQIRLLPSRVIWPGRDRCGSIAAGCGAAGKVGSSGSNLANQGRDVANSSRNGFLPRRTFATAVLLDADAAPAGVAKVRRKATTRDPTTSTCLVQ